jgi:hypothetical protein
MGLSDHGRGEVAAAQGAGSGAKAAEAVETESLLPVPVSAPLPQQFAVVVGADCQVHWGKDGWLDARVQEATPTGAELAFEQFADQYCDVKATEFATRIRARQVLTKDGGGGMERLDQKQAPKQAVAEAKVDVINAVEKQGRATRARVQAQMQERAAAPSPMATAVARGGSTALVCGLTFTTRIVGYGYCTGRLLVPEDGLAGSGGGGGGVGSGGGGGCGGAGGSGAGAARGWLVRFRGQPDRVYSGAKTAEWVRTATSTEVALTCDDGASDDGGASEESEDADVDAAPTKAVVGDQERSKRPRRECESKALQAVAAPARPRRATR